MLESQAEAKNEPITMLVVTPSECYLAACDSDNLVFILLVFTRSWATVTWGGIKTLLTTPLVWFLLQCLTKLAEASECQTPFRERLDLQRVNNILSPRPLLSILLWGLQFAKLCFRNTKNDIENIEVGRREWGLKKLPVAPKLVELSPVSK